MKVSRRIFLKSGGVAMVGMSTIPAFLQRAVAATPMPNKKKLIVVFQRGAADGLNIVVPFGEENYYRIRPTIAIPQPRSGAEGTAVDLDGFFGLHPSLAPLGPLFHDGQLAIVHAAGSPDMTRSHFDAQDFMESGTPGVKSTDDGWLNRTVQAMREEDASPFRAVAMGPNLPLTLRGSAPAIALADVKQFRVMSQSTAIQGGFEALYAQTVDKVLRGTGTETFEAIDMLRKADPSQFQPEHGAEYPKGHIGQTMQRVAQLLKAEDLSSTQYNVLRILRGAPEGLACGEIGNRMITRDPDITRLLDRLEKRGLVSRCRETKDRRMVLTRITDKGLELLARLDEPVQEAHRAQLGHLGREGLQSLVDLVRRARSEAS